MKNLPLEDEHEDNELISEIENEMYKNKKYIKFVFDPSADGTLHCTFGSASSPIDVARAAIAILSGSYSAMKSIEQYQSYADTLRNYILKNVCKSTFWEPLNREVIDSNHPCGPLC